MGLCIEREVGESFVIDGNIVVTLYQVRGSTTGKFRARLIVEAPQEVKILRSELIEGGKDATAMG